MPPTIVTGDSGLSAEMKTFYERQLLERALANYVHQDFAQMRSLPRGGGKTVEFRKFSALAVATTPLTEGVTPTGKSLTVTNLTASIAQYGDYVEGSDLVVATTFDPVLSESSKLLGEQYGDTFDQLVRDVIAAGTSVQYANGRANRGSIVATDVLNSTELRKAVRTLEKNKAKPVNGGSWVGIISPDTKYDLQADSKWENASNYSGGQPIFAGELGKLWNVRFVETTNAKVFTGGGSGGVDVHATIILGANAYGVIQLDGEATSMFFKDVGSAGTADPLNQRWTLGWKNGGFVTLILQQLFMLRIEHGVTA